MILPLISAYLLFAWITSYHSDKKVAEYYEVYAEIQSINSMLREPELYIPETSMDEVEDITTNRLSITLYNGDGLKIYSSIPDTVYTQQFLEREKLLTNLYDLNQGLHSFTYKEPVFHDDGEMVGVFEVKVAREQLLSTISKRAWIVTVSFILSFILIYVFIAMIVNSRINKRLDNLMEEMVAFASGKEFPESYTGKDEIGELTQHFYAMKKQINSAQEMAKLEQKAKEYMVATISHDLKTPLTSIKAYAESLDSTTPLSEEQHSYRKVIIDKADFMKQMINDLITHTLLQSHDYDLEFVSVDGEEFFDMIISDYEAMCKEKNITLQSFNNVKGQYDVNPKQFVRIADNLMTNAIQHTEVGGEICIASLSSLANVKFLFDFVYQDYHFDFENNAYLIVQNEGNGIPETEIPQLFNPLYQADKSRSKKDAHRTGLGLSIAKQIIEKHDGTITVLSKQGIGVCFICAIPKKEGHHYEKS